MKILTHPNNLAMLRFMTHPTEEPIGIFGVEVVTNRHLPERDMRPKWEPPPSDRFVEYGPEDEAWMKPLGMGKIVKVDMGPLFYQFNERLLRSVFNNRWPAVLIDT